MSNVIKALEKIEDTISQYKGKTYLEMLELSPLKIDEPYNCVDTNEFSQNIVNIHNFIEYEDIPWLKYQWSPLNWICTDTRVGLCFIYELNEQTEEWEAVGLYEQTGRKNDKFYHFFSKEARDRVIKRFFKEFIYKNIDEFGPSIVDINDKVLK